MIIANSHQFDPRVIYFCKFTTFSQWSNYVLNITLSISCSSVSEVNLSVAIATNKNWTTILAVNHPDICEKTLTPILGSSKFRSNFYIIIFRRTIRIAGHFTTANMLRLSPIIDLCIVGRSHSVIIYRKALIPLNCILQQFAHPVNLTDKHDIIPNHQPCDDYNLEMWIRSHPEGGLNDADTGRGLNRIIIAPIRPNNDLGSNVVASFLVIFF